MALIVEDGTGKADADTYCSLADATSYHAAMGNTAWAALANDTLREQALRRAAAYMVQTYRTRWAGYRVSKTQALDWPRYDVPQSDTVDGDGAAYYANNVVPVEVRNACAELALRASAGSLLSDEGREVLEQTVGPITTKYARGGDQSKRYTAVDALLAGLLESPKGGVMMRLVRA
jgi:hypothetical protein